MAIDNTLTLGQYLRRERERRGLTIEQVASATKIGIRTLHALEGDHYAELPAKPFIRGFVISYARFIGLDPKETLTHFNLFLDERVHQERPNREGGHSGYAFEKREGDQSRTMLGVAMGSFVVIGAIAMVFLKPTLKHHHGSRLDKLRSTQESPSPLSTSLDPPITAQASAQASSMASASPLAIASPAAENSPRVLALDSPPPSTTTPSVAPTPTLSSTPKPTSRTEAIPSPVPNSSHTPSAPPSPSASAVPSDPLNSGLGLKPSEITQRVVCKALDSVWVRYKVDDKPVMQFILKKDKVLVLRGRQSIVLQAGEPEHLNLSGNRTAYHTVDADPNITTRQSDSTLFFPPQLAKTIEEPFPGEKPLSSRKSPATPAPSATPTSTP
jgi:cytoskeletal protein RodZ